MNGMLVKHPISQRKICKLLDLNQSVGSYHSEREDQDCEIKILKYAHQRKRFGYPRIHLLLKMEGIKVKHKKSLSSLQRTRLKSEQMSSSIKKNQSLFIHNKL